MRGTKAGRGSASGSSDFMLGDLRVFPELERTLHAGKRLQDVPAAARPHLPAYSFPATHSFTPASAAGRFSGWVPPAWAMSGRPPPLPPTCWATKLTSSPALTLAVW